MDEANTNLEYAQYKGFAERLLVELEEFVKQASESYIKFYKKKSKADVAQTLKPIASIITNFITEALESMKYEDVTITTEHKIDDIKVRYVFDNKAKTYLLGFWFKDKKLGERQSIISIKFADQLSKPIVPSQIIKFKRSVERLVNKFLMKKYRGAWTRVKVDVSLFIIAYNYTKGCLDLIRDMNSVETTDLRVRYFTYIVKFNEPYQVIEKIVEFFKYRAGSLALSFHNKYREELRVWKDVPSKVKGTLKSLLKVAFKVRELLGYSKVDDRTLDEVATRMVVEGVSDPFSFL